MIRAILFDLDDTLYLEGDFFRSGFAIVAAILEARGIAPAAEARIILDAIHFGGDRERVFDQAAVRLDFPASWVPELVRIFRSHEPAIAPARDVPAALERLRSRYKLGCVTDGWADVQRRKLVALGLEPFFDSLVIADDKGRAYWKPHTLPFLTCCQQLGVVPEEAIFVGDNPDRDVRGACSSGMACIRIRRHLGYYSAKDFPSDQPVAEITDLTELDALLQGQRCTEEER